MFRCSLPFWKLFVNHKIFYSSPTGCPSTTTKTEAAVFMGWLFFRGTIVKNSQHTERHFRIAAKHRFTHFIMNFQYFRSLFLKLISFLRIRYLHQTLSLKECLFIYLFIYCNMHFINFVLLKTVLVNRYGHEAHWIPLK